ncbi:MAG: dockerin type I domain-containing protein [Pirellulales bacterium]
MSRQRRPGQRSRKLRNTSHNRPRRFSVESLESRQLLDASTIGGPTFDFDSETGLLTVTTTPNDDVVTATVVPKGPAAIDPVEQRILHIDVETGGSTFSWSGPYHEVTGIQFDLDAGDDSLLVRNTVGQPITVNAAAGNDTIVAGSGAARISGGDGDDNITGSEKGDTIDAGRGNDTVAGLGGGDTIQGGWGNDNLSGGTGNDTIIGDPGDWDRIEPIPTPDPDETPMDVDGEVLPTDATVALDLRANDVISGDEGNDRIHGMAGDDEISGGDGFDGIAGGSGNDTISGGDEPYIVYIRPGPVGDRISGGRGDDKIDAGNGDDAVSGDEGNDFIQGGWGNDWLSGGVGNDVIIGDPGDLSVDAIRMSDGTEQAVDAMIVRNDDEIIRSRGHNDTILGGEGSDRLHGMFGDDIIDGGAGSDGIHGGSGNDQIDGGDEGPVFIILAGVNVPSYQGDKIDGGRGDDDIDGGAGDDAISGGEGDDTIQGGWGSDQIDGDGGNDVLIGDPGDIIRVDRVPVPNDVDYRAEGDVIVEPANAGPTIVPPPTRGNDRIRGGDGNDRIHGMYGNDTIDGGAGFDGIAGGSGDDTIDGGDEPFIVYVAGDPNIVPGPLGDKISGGYGNDVIDAGRGDDYVSGDEGDDHIQGGWGNDTLDGGAGSDQIVGDPRDLVPTPVPAAYALAANFVPPEPIDPTDAANLRGNDTIFGEAGNDRIHGMFGNDVISGGRGHDGIDGGSGDDEIRGDSGNDKLLGGSGNDDIDGGFGNDWIGGGAGNDLIQGGWGNDEIHGNDGNDSILGDPGDVDSIDPTPDPDSNRDIPVAGEILRDDAERPHRRTGNDLIYGDAGNDRINGMYGNDRIRGGDGNDGIAGGSGNDRIGGGEGNDRIYGGRGRDRLLGGADDDRIVGGPGRDYLEGDAGADGINALDGVIDAICRDNLDTVSADPDDVFVCFNRPVMDAVRVRSSRWDDKFESRPAENAMMGEAGGEIDIDGDGTTTIPWGDIDQIVVAFDQDVSVDADSLVIVGMDGRYAVAAFRYDAATFTATWTLAKSIDGDRIAMHFVDCNGQVIGNGLDVPQSPESAAAFDSSTSTYFNVAAGDVNGDGTVDIRDVRQAAASGMFTTAGEDGYIAEHDFDGDGRITILDALGIRDSQGTRLPGGTPSIGGAPAAAAALVVNAPQQQAADRVLRAGGFAQANRRQDARRAVAEHRSHITRSSVDTALGGDAPATTSALTAIRARRALRSLDQ